MMKKLLIVSIVMVLVFPAVSFAVSEVIMENDNVTLTKRVDEDSNEINYTLELISTDQCATLTFFDKYFALTTTIDVMVIDENNQAYVLFQIGDDEPGFVMMDNLFAQTLVISKNQQAEAVIISEMRENQDVMRVAVECGGDPNRVYEFNLKSFVPICNEFFKLIQ